MSEIEDPLGRFLEEEQSRDAGVKNPVTGIREPAELAKKKQNREDETKRKAQVSKRIITQLMNNDLGREWLYDILGMCNIHSIPCAEISAFNSGAMHIGKSLEADIRHYAIKEYSLMIQEGWEREKMWSDEAADK